MEPVITAARNSQFCFNKQKTQYLTKQGNVSMNHTQNYIHSVRLLKCIGYSEVSTALK